MRVTTYSKAPFWMALSRRSCRFAGVRFERNSSSRRPAGRPPAMRAKGGAQAMGNHAFSFGRWAQDHGLEMKTEIVEVNTRLPANNSDDPLWLTESAAQTAVVTEPTKPSHLLVIARLR